MLEFLRRLVYLTFRPTEEWRRIAHEPATADGLLRSYIIPLALPTPVATYTGMKVFDGRWDRVHGYLVPADQVFATAAMTFFGIVASILLLAAIFCAVARMYRAKPDFLASLKVATFGAMPLLVSGAVLVFPDLVIIPLAALCHTVFLYYKGASAVLDVRAEQEEFIGISFVLLALGSLLAGAAVASVGIL